MKTYRGYAPRRVVVQSGTSVRPLAPRHDLRNHSPDGFRWGYGGSGPAQLALAIVADALGDDARALRIYQQYKWAVVGNLPSDLPWTITQGDVLQKVDQLERERDAKCQSQ